MAKRIIKLAIFLLVVHALYRFVPIYLHYQQFKDAVKETALFSSGKSDSEIIDRVMGLAEGYHIPLEREYVQVRREGERTFIDASYVEFIEWAPTYRRPWQFDVGAQAWHIKPVTAGEVPR